MPLAGFWPLSKDMNLIAYNAVPFHTSPRAPVLRVSDKIMVQTIISNGSERAAYPSIFNRVPSVFTTETLFPD